MASTLSELIYLSHSIVLASCFSYVLNQIKWSVYREVRCFKGVGHLNFFWTVGSRSKAPSFFLYLWPLSFPQAPQLVNGISADNASAPPSGEAALLSGGANAPPKHSKTVDLVKISPYMHPQSFLISLLDLLEKKGHQTPNPNQANRMARAWIRTLIGYLENQVLDFSKTT